MTRKTADDLPSSALSTMRSVLDLCEKVFPNYNRSEGCRVFVDSYFNHQINGPVDAGKMEGERKCQLNQ